VKLLHSLNNTLKQRLPKSSQNFEKLAQKLLGNLLAKLELSGVIVKHLVSIQFLVVGLELSFILSRNRSWAEDLLFWLNL
jgi:hypothetical protein